MELTTPIIVQKSSFSINYNSRIMFAGSCFAENISQFFADSKFHCLVNPSGIVYNPLSLSVMLHNVEQRRIYTSDDFFFDGQYYNSYDFHGSFSGPDLDNVLRSVNQSVAAASDFLSSANCLFITLGTSFVYFLHETGLPVSNCHRQNPKLFSRRMLSVQEVLGALTRGVNSVRALNPDLHIVFTVSPIRHIRDGYRDNTLSKSVLHLAISELLNTIPNCEYFPSYEILMDELRDYRFYADDMVHVSPLAERIIWQRIKDTYMSPNVQQQLRRVEKFMLAVHHKIQDPDSLQTQEFCQKNLSLAFALESDIQGLDLSAEKKYFKSFIKVC